MLLPEVPDLLPECNLCTGKNLIWWVFVLCHSETGQNWEFTTWPWNLWQGCSTTQNENNILHILEEIFFGGGGGHAFFLLNFATLALGKSFSDERLLPAWQFIPTVSNATQITVWQLLKKKHSNDSHQNPLLILEYGPFPFSYSLVLFVFSVSRES